MAQDRLLERTGVIATAVPTWVGARVAARTGRPELADRLRARAASVPVASRLGTIPFWLIVVLRGLLYPTMAGDPATSWGGPTLVGAWVVHLLIALAMLLALSLGLAWLERQLDR